MQTFIFIVLLLGGLAWYYLEQPVFGKLPSGKREERIAHSPNFKGGQFVNQEHTPNFAPGISMWDATLSFFNKPENTEPSRSMPSVRTDLRKLDTEDAVVWFGHSSYYMQASGLKILADPVFSGNASPIKYFAKSFEGANVYAASDIPDLDILLLTHDHYDHLDYKTILELKGRFKKVITSLGVGAHLNHWGIPDEQIIELDWYESATLAPGITITALPARHFSGRKFTRNQSIWSSFALHTPKANYYLGGDSGYGKHFKEIGEKYGPFKLALLECGQYNAMWPYIHMMPEEVVSAAQDLKAETLMPVHWGKFALAMHDWNEPANRVLQAAKDKQMPITTPLIGEVVKPGTHYPDSIWWRF